MVIDMTGIWTSAKTVQEKRIEVNRPGYDGGVAQVALRRTRKKVETPVEQVQESSEVQAEATNEETAKAE